MKKHRLAGLIQFMVLAVAIAVTNWAARGQVVIAWGNNTSGQTNVPPSATNVIAVAGGGSHSLALRADGTVVSWGSLSSVDPAATNVVAIAAGAQHSLALRGDGTVVAWGNNTRGQLNVPAAATNTVAISAGHYHNLALQADGSVIAWGYNSSGQTNVPAGLGRVIAISAGATQSVVMQEDGAIITFGAPSSVPHYFPNQITAIAAGAVHNLFLNANGTVGVYGTSSYAPTGTTNVVAIAAGTNYSVALRSTGRLVAWGTGTVTNVPASATNLFAVACGFTHALAIKGDGSPRLLGPTAFHSSATLGESLPLSARAVGIGLSYQWFANGAPIAGAANSLLPGTVSFATANTNYFVVVSNGLGSVTGSLAQVSVRPFAVWGHGQLDGWGSRRVPLNISDPIALAVGTYFGLALNSDGSFTAWGKSADGQTTIPSEATNVVAVDAGGDHGLALQRDGTVVAWGRNWDGQTDVPPSATNVVSISAGWAHSLALRADGTVLAWGNNSHGQTAVSFLVPQAVAISAGYYHSLALRRDGRVVSWGKLETVPELATNITAVSAGRGHNLGLRKDGTVLAWGDNDLGQCAVPSSATNVVAIAAGWFSSLALRADGTVVAWGGNQFGQTNAPTALSNAVSIVMGEDFALALARVGQPRLQPLVSDITTRLGGQALIQASASSGDPASFQWYHDGAAINGATNTSLIIDNVGVEDGGSYLLVACNGYGCATNEPVQLTVNTEPEAISAVGCWGDDSLGQRPVPTTVVAPKAIAAGHFHNLALNADGTVVGWGKNTSGQTSVPPGLANVTRIAAGGDHSLALKDDGTVVAWGRDWDGQTNVPPQVTNTIAIAAGWAHSMALQSNGTVVVWGNSAYGQTNLPLWLPRIQRIAAGYYHSLALCEDGSVVAWGSVDKVPAGATNVVAIAAGREHSLALRADGTVVAWGDNTYGQTNVPPDATNLVAVAAGWGTSVGLRADGVLKVWGRAEHGLTAVPAGLDNIAALAAGEDHIMALVELGPPRLLRGPVDVAAHAGSSPVLALELSGTQPLVGQWSHNGNDIAGATARFLTLADVQDDAVGTYTYRVTNAVGQAGSFDTQLAVLNPPKITTRTTHQVFQPGASLILTAAASGKAPLDYQWLKDGLPLTDGSGISGSTTPTLFINLVGDSDRGVYELKANNSYGSATGAVALVEITPVIAWGDGSKGQLMIPRAATNATSLAAGDNHSLAIDAAGRVLAWGDNSYRQTEVPSSATNVVAVAAGDRFSLALRADGTVVGWGFDSQSVGITNYGAAQVPDAATNIVAIAAGNWHALALRSDCSVLAWGLGASGQTTIPASATNVVAIAASATQSLGLRADGSLVAWGTGPAVPSFPYNMVSIAVGGTNCLGLTPDGRIVEWYANGYRTAATPAEATNVVAIAARGDNVMALRPDGRGIAWGDGVTGQNQVPAVASNAVMIAVGGSHSLVLADSYGQGRTWTNSLTRNWNSWVGMPVILAANEAGLVGSQWLHNGEVVAGATLPFLFLNRAEMSSAGTYILIATNRSGGITHQHFNLTVNNEPIVDTPAQQFTIRIGSGLCLQTKAYGEEPLQFRWLRNGTNVVDGPHISGAATRTLCITSARSSDTAEYFLEVSNSVGVVTNLIGQVSVTPVVAWGWSGQTNVPGSATNVVAVAGGDSHSLALRSDGTVIGWGSSSFAGVPTSITNVVAIDAGGVHDLALQADGTVLAWGSNSYGETNVPASATNVVAIAAGYHHCMALQADGRVLAWGSNSSGQTNVPASATNVVAIAAGYYTCMALRSDGTVLAWGQSFYGQTNVPTSVTNVVAIAAGSDHCMALRGDGTILVWGANTRGQTNVPASATNVVAIAAGSNHCEALQADGKVLAWGFNLNGQTSVPASATNTVAIEAGGNNGLALLRDPELVRPAAHIEQSVSIGGAALLAGVSMGGSRAWHQWSYNGIVLSGETNAALNLADFGWANVGTYTLITSNAFGYSLGLSTTLSAARTQLEFDPHSLAYDSMTGNFTGQITGAAGMGDLVVFASTDLHNWVPVFTNAPVVGSVWFSHAVASGETVLFYRAAEMLGAREPRLYLDVLDDPLQPEGSLLRIEGLSASGPVVISASTNLVDWVPVHTNPPTIGPLQFFEPGLTGMEQRFYRASEWR